MPDFLSLRFDLIRLHTFKEHRTKHFETRFVVSPKAIKKKPLKGAFFMAYINCSNYNLETCFVNLDFKLDALLS
jgi:hypothetical protein